MADNKQNQNRPVENRDADQSTPATDPLIILAQAIVAGQKAQTEALIAAQPPRQITFSEFKPVTPFNPKGIQNRVLPGGEDREYYQNGNRLHVDLLHDEEIRLLGMLKPGKFINGLVVVSHKDVGNNRIHVHIRSNASTADQRSELKGEAKDFTTVLRRCVEEADAAVA